MRRDASRVEAMSALINYVEKCCANIREKNAKNVLIVFNKQRKNNIVFCILQILRVNNYFGKINKTIPCSIVQA